MRIGKSKFQFVSRFFTFLLILGFPPHVKAEETAIRLSLKDSSPFAGQTPDEPSGMVSSRVMPGIFWGHNDSGGSSKVFAFRFRPGIDVQPRLIATLDFGQNCNGRCTNVDFEDLSIDKENRLYVSDTGNNSQSRPVGSMKIIRVREPLIPNYLTRTTIEAMVAPATDIETLFIAFSPGYYEREGFYRGTEAPLEINNLENEALYMAAPDYDVEAMAVHPISGDLYLITKRFELGSRTSPSAFLFRLDSDAVMKCPGRQATSTCWVPATMQRISNEDRVKFVVFPQFQGQIARMYHNILEPGATIGEVQEVAEVNEHDKVTAMDFSPGGRMLVVMTYMKFSVYSISGTSVTAEMLTRPIAVGEFNYPYSGRRLVPQAEAVGFGAISSGYLDATDIYMLSEQSSKVRRFSLQ